MADSNEPIDGRGRTPQRVAMVVGESSGDLLGSRVMRSLRKAFPHMDFTFEGVGGEAMLAEGFESLYPMERLAVMGLVEPLGRLPELLRIRSALRRRWRNDPPRFFLGVDAQDFNLGLARSLRVDGITTAQLVSPTVWAWRPKRIHKVARAVNQLLCLFPFEPAMYADVDVDARYVGHPLVSELAGGGDRHQARRELGVDAHSPLIALLPGSRRSEVASLAPVMLEAGRLLKSRDARRQFIMPAANSERLQQCQELLTTQGDADTVTLVEGCSREVMVAADVVLLASGTASLEAMLLQRPMVIAYRMAALSFALMEKLAVTRFVGLPNVLAGEAVVTELLQDDLSAPALALEAESLLLHGQTQVDTLARCRDALTGDFDSAVADALAGFLDTNAH